MLLYFPPHLSCGSALSCETGKPEIASFHFNIVCCFANKQSTFKLSTDRSWTSLHSQSDRLYAPDT